MSYFVLRASEDGFSVKEVTKEWLLKELSEEGSGYEAVQVVDHLPTEPDPNYWGNTLVIIKGEVVTPEPVQVISEYHLP